MIAVNTTYGSKYQALKELGSGTRSSVWLVNNIPYELSLSLVLLSLISDETFAAMKVFNDQNRANLELQAMSSIPVNLAREFHVCALVDQFVSTGPNGKIQCLIFEPMGPTAQEIYMALTGPFFGALHKRFCRQVLTALRFLHETCQLIHTGSSDRDFL
jgi:serine/threonine-protein kinase SRPK3